MSDDKITTLDELQSLTGISDSAILWLLKNNRLRCKISENGELLIALSGVKLEHFIQAMGRRQAAALSAQERIIAESFANIISEQLPSIIEEAVNLVKQS